MSLANLTGIAPNAIDLSYGDLTLAPRSMVPELVVQDLWTGAEQPPFRVSNLQHARSLGRRIAGYFALSSSRSGAGHYAAMRNGLPDDLWAALEFLVVDVELEGLWEAQIREALDLAEKAKGQRIIYTGRWFWPRQPYAHAGFGDVKLWDARYMTAGVVPAWLPYGAWDFESELVGVQVQGGHMIGGCLVDTSVFDFGRLGMDAQTKAAIGAILTTLGAAGERMDGIQARQGAIAGALADHIQHGGNVDPALAAQIATLQAEIVADRAKWQAAAAAAAQALGIG